MKRESVFLGESDRLCDSFLRFCWIENFNSTLKNRLINNMLFLDIVAKIMTIWMTETYVSYKKLWNMLID
mgnify:CR=1